VVEKSNTLIEKIKILENVQKAKFKIKESIAKKHSIMKNHLKALMVKKLSIGV